MHAGLWILPREKPALTSDEFYKMQIAVRWQVNPAQGRQEQQPAASV